MGNDVVSQGVVRPNRGGLTTVNKVLEVVELRKNIYTCISL